MHNQQTARKQPTPGLARRQVEVSTSEEEENEPEARKKPRPKAKKMEADSSVDAPGAAAPPMKKLKKSRKKGKEEAATPSTPKLKKTPSAKKRNIKGIQEDHRITKYGKRRVRPRRRDTSAFDTEETRKPPTNIPSEQDRKRKVLVEYSTDDEVSEALLDESILKGDYAGIDTKKIKRVKREVQITIPSSPMVPTYPESFIAWYKDHGMTVGMKAAQ